ncbi:hypothetical protein VaK_0058 [Vibrio phage VaK]|nr:hypothetical protein pVa4_0059 [Vibrio phage pVa-4]ARH11748.1 hypothetical protein VaK_0058 [Vibrio phage VaK]ARH11872.2 hypothetical protein pVa7_0059 [Vibrio phage pVa-7]ARV27648.1 hypothetical protein A6A12_1521 [Vibrio anguillarum]
MISSCSGCQKRREWLIKWSKIAYERSRKIIADSKAKSADATEGAGKPSGVSK